MSVSSKRKAFLEALVGIGLSTAAAVIWIWVTSPQQEIRPARETEAAVTQETAEPVGRRLEDLYADADVVAHVQVVDRRGPFAAVRELAVFKSDGRSLLNVQFPWVFCGQEFEIGGQYLVFAERAHAESDAITVLEGWYGDEIATHVSMAAGDRSSGLIERIENISGVRAYTTPPQRVVARTERPSGCTPDDRRG